MEFDWDKKGIKYIFGLLIIGMVLVFVMNFSGRELETYYYEIESPQLLAEVPQANLASRPAFSEIAKKESVFLPAREVLAKFEELKNARDKFIFADLKRMRLSYYENGVETEPFEILSKGREGSFFETPSGIYSISYKEENHFSTIGKVWMPWSLHFFGNYFIHGWPYYPGGKPVAQSFSGGCIRLSADDSRKLFRLAGSGMPLLIYSGTGNDSELAAIPAAVFTNDSYFRKLVFGRAPAAPTALSAGAYLAADFETGQILLSKNEKMIYPIASITKLMTALVASEMYHGRTFKITKKTLEEYGTSGGLKNSEVFEAGELLYPLLLASSNDAAAAFELESLEFIPSMNKKARAMGLAATSFADASGLGPQNVSTAEDLFKLLKYIYSYKKPIFDILSLKEYKLASKNKHQAHLWDNINWPKGNKNFVAGKVGHTDEALETTIGIYKLKLSEGEGREIAIVVLRSHDQKGDTDKIAKYLGENFVYGNVLVKNQVPQEKPRVIFNEANIYEAIF